MLSSRAFVHPRSLSRASRQFSSSVSSPLKSSYGLWVDGKEVDSENGQYIDVEDPARGTVLTKVAAGTEVDMTKAVAVAKEAFEDGRCAPAVPIGTIDMILSSLCFAETGGPACPHVTVDAS